MIQKYRGDSG